MSDSASKIDPPVGSSPSGDDASGVPVRSFSLRSAFALSFTDISPIVGIYSVFGIGLVVAGPAFWWAFPFVLFFQLLVTGVFGDLVSRCRFKAACMPGHASWLAADMDGGPTGGTTGLSRFRSQRSPSTRRSISRPRWG